MRHADCEITKASWVLYLASHMANAMAADSAVLTEAVRTVALIVLDLLVATTVYLSLAIVHASV